MASTYVQSNRLMTTFFGSGINIPVASLYLGLSKTAPNETGGGVTEPTGVGYSRILIDNTDGAGYWTHFSDGSVKNAVLLEFQESGSEWATSAAPITHLFLADTLSGVGTSILYYGALITPRAIPSETTIYFVQNSLIVKMA